MYKYTFLSMGEYKMHSWHSTQSKSLYGGIYKFNKDVVKFVSLGLA